MVADRPGPGPRPQVRISGGILQGIVTHSTSHPEESAHAFLNIRYAAAPTGSLRFAPPQPPPAWTGVCDCSVHGLEPVQRDEAQLPFQLPRSGKMNSSTGLPDHMGEDTLTLNVFTPIQPKMAPLPVMAYIYGGGFNNGAASLPMYDGTRLCNRKRAVIVVTINYRLGGIGFLYKPDSDIPSNLGMLDMIYALKFIQREIGSFGGDANRVTIFGESAGGMACASLLGSPLSRGLFARVICISGAASGVRKPKEAAKAADALATELNINTISMSTLGVVPVEELRQAMMRAAKKVGGVFGPVLAGPVFPGDTPPIKSLRADVDLLSGCNRDENNLFMARGEAPTQAVLEKGLVETLGRSDDYIPISDPVESARRILSELAAEPKLWWGSSSAELRKGVWLQMSSDLSFNLAHERTLDAHRGRRFAYRFDYESPITHWTDGRMLPTSLGACHALGIMFMFGNHNANSALSKFCGTGDAVDRLAARLMDSFTTFASTGSPETQSTGPWPLHDPFTRPCMIFGASDNPASVKLVPNPRAAALAAWSGFRHVPAKL